MTVVDRQDVATRLRDWGRGSLSMTAGVDLLVRAFDGRFAQLGAPWIHIEPDGSAWVGVTALRDAHGLSGGERRVLTLVAALLDPAPLDVVDVVTGLDRANLHLVLAALAHAGESHEHFDVDPDGLGHLTRPGPLIAWPT